MKKIFLIFMAAAVMLQFAACKNSNTAQKKEAVKLSYADRAKKIYDVIKADYYNEKDNLYYETDIGKQGLDENKYSYNWPAGAVMQGIIDMQKANIYRDQKITQTIADCIMKYYDNVHAPAPGYDSYVYELGGGQRFYDDNEWVGLAYLDAYGLEKDDEYLQRAIEIYNFIITGYDDKMGGGLYWRENDLETKNTCSNGPGIVLALRLYEITKDNRYVDFARKIYDWTNKNLLSPEGVYWDHVKSDGTIEYTNWTYNTGIMIQSNVLFYKTTGDDKYLKEAQRLAESSLKHFAPKGLFPDTYWFNAVLLRGYRDLYEVDRNDKFIKAFEKYALYVWDNQRDDTNKIGTKKPKPVIDQGAMLEIYSVLSQLEMQKFKS